MFDEEFRRIAEEDSLNGELTLAKDHKKSNSYQTMSTAVVTPAPGGQTENESAREPKK